jgi:CheY-like chemotaxis protein
MTESKPVVLAVDDTPSNLDLLHAVLSDDYMVKVATNGEKALELAAREPRPDIILLDVMMPGMSGHEVCTALKQSPETMPIPVIFVTAMSQAEDEQTGLALGAVDYITKPFNHEIVKARVRTHLANYENTRELIRENRELRDAKGRSFTDFDEPGLLALIERGEDHAVEFKSTLRWNLFADRSDKGIENSCLKTVAGYLNTDGGVLLVGVDDDGAIIGLGKDHFKTEDKLLLHWVNLVKSYLGAEFMPYMRSMIKSVADQRLLVVECLPSTKPVFFARDNEESFFVRMTNSTQALKASESVSYIEEHFAKRQQAESGPDDKPADAAGVSAASEPGAEKDANSGQKADSTLAGWFNELMQRHVIRTSVIYFVVAWALTESGTMIAETLNAPAWVQIVIVLVFVAGFPIVVLLSWLYDIKATQEETPASALNRRRTLWLVGILSLAAIVTIASYLNPG